ncbi:PEGA domain-containing protein, partial [bacterium]|nr:PEGA domain-containing protein [bacterium]
MNPKGKTQIILASLILSALLFQNCATIYKGTSQKIPITSEPSGTMIMVDGNEIGHVPLVLKLRKNKSHIIRIEKQGYNPYEIKIMKKSSISMLAILGNYLLAGTVGYISMVSPTENRDNSWWPIIGLTLGLTLVDFLSGANFTLSPTELHVTLTKLEGKSQPNFILIDAEQFQNIKWIRIKCET